MLQGFPHTVDPFWEILVGRQLVERGPCGSREYFFPVKLFQHWLEVMLKSSIQESRFKPIVASTVLGFLQESEAFCPLQHRLVVLVELPFGAQIS